jgi:hypothetical protein
VDIGAAKHPFGAWPPKRIIIDHLRPHKLGVLFLIKLPVFTDSSMP